jgi:hypothetical protein
MNAHDCPKCGRLVEDEHRLCWRCRYRSRMGKKRRESHKQFCVRDLDWLRLVLYRCGAAIHGDVRR